MRSSWNLLSRAIKVGQPEAARAVASVLQDEAQADVSTLIRLALKKLSGA